MKNICLLVAAGMALLMSACSSDPRSDAVEHAREYALEHSKNLTPLQRNHIRYNDPVLMNSLIFEDSPIGFESLGHVRNRYSGTSLPDPNSDYMQQCMVWNPPGLGASFVVAGTGDRAYRFWRPERIVVKNFIVASEEKERMRVSAAEYAIANLPHLDAAERDTVRFSMPKYAKTSLSLPVKKEKKETWRDYLGMDENENPGKQISLIWKSPKDSSCIVVTGRGASQADWKPQKAVQMSVEAFNRAAGTAVQFPVKESKR